MVCPDVSAPTRKANMGTCGKQSLGGGTHWGRDLALTPSEADHSGKQTRTDESKKQHIYLGL